MYIIIVQDGGYWVRRYQQRSHTGLGAVIVSVKEVIEVVCPIKGLEETIMDENKHELAV